MESIFLRKFVQVNLSVKFAWLCFSLLSFLSKKRSAGVIPPFEVNRDVNKVIRIRLSREDFTAPTAFSRLK